MKIKKGWITIIIIISVIILAIFLINKSSNGVDKETAICIGENSELYVQLGCHACETQEKMFGGNYKYLNIIDCFYEKEKCGVVVVNSTWIITPTWIINNEKYPGVQSIDKLKELTGCS